MAMSQQFFDDFLPIGAPCNTNQRNDSFDQYYANPDTDADNDTGIPENLMLSHIPWSTAPTTTTTTTTSTTIAMPRNSNGAIEVPARHAAAHDDLPSWKGKSLSPGRRSSTRTPSTSSSHKSSMSRASVSSKSSAPSADDSTSKRRTRSAATASCSNEYTSSNNYNNHNKRDKFLERNRVAASKCRQRKKEWVNGLEEAKNGLEAQNSHLQMELNGLLSEVSRMKNQIMAHASCHDPNIDKWIDNEARRFVQGPEVAEYPGAAVGYDTFPGPGAAPPFPPMGYQGFDEDTRLSPTDTVMSDMPGRLDGAERARVCIRHAEAVGG